MPKLRLAELRSELSATHHDARVRRMLELGRQAREDAGVRGLIDTMSHGEAYERRLALTAQFTWRDGARVLRATTDDSARVRGLALRLVPLACDDTQALEVLQMAYAMRRADPLLKGLVARGRRAVIDPYLDWLVSRSDVHDFADTVPLASPEGLRRHLARALQRPSARFWARLAQGAPEVLGAVLAERVRAVSGEADAVTRFQVDAYLPHLANHAPEQALELCELLQSRKIQPRPQVWTELVKHRPQATLEFFQRHGLSLPWKLFARAVTRFDEASLVWIVQRNPGALGELGKLLPELSEPSRRAITEAWCRAVDVAPSWGTQLLKSITDPAIREHVYSRWSVAARDRDGVISVGMLAALPADLQAREAHRHLREVIALGTRPRQRMEYARFLPWDEALSVLQSYIGHPEGDMRGAALGTVLALPGLHPTEAAWADKAIAMVLARKNEQDPVRGVMLQTLVGWPREVWRREHTEPIGRMLRDALDAADLSSNTARAAETLLVRNFSLDPVWGAKWLGTLVKERGVIYNPRLGDHLSDDEVRTAAPQLLEIARAWAARERGGPLLQLAESLGARAALVPGLRELLASVRDETPERGLALGITNWLSRHDRERFESTLGATMRRWYDRGWEPEINALASKETGALHPELIAALERVALRLGDHSGGAITLLRHRALPEFDRLLPRLLEKDRSVVCLPVVTQYMHRRRQDLLTPFLDAPVISGRFATGKTRWILPFEGGFFRWTAGQSATYSRTLEWLLTDRERDTPTLLWATTLLAALDFGPMEGLCVLADDNRPAVREKALRVMARCDQGQGVPTLLRCLEDARARIAIYGLRRAFAGMPPSRVVTLLTSVPMTKVTVAKEVVRLLGELRSDAAYERLIALDATPLHRDVRIAMLRALWDHLDREPTWAVFERAVSAEDWVMASRVGDIPADRLTGTTDRRLSALLGRVLSRPEPEARIDLLRRAAYLSVRDPERTFLVACGARLSSVHDDEVTAAMQALLNRADERDMERLEGMLVAVMEDRRALSVALQQLLQLQVKTRAVYIQAAHAAERVLARDPRLAPLRVRCAAAAMKPPELAARLVEMGGAGHLHTDALEACRMVVEGIPFEALEAFEAALRGSTSAEARRIAVWCLIRDAGPNRGWTPERLARLAAYQRDPSPLVSGAAQFVFPPREMVTPTTSSSA